MRSQGKLLPPAGKTGDAENGTSQEPAGSYGQVRDPHLCRDRGAVEPETWWGVASIRSATWKQRDENAQSITPQ